MVDIKEKEQTPTRNMSLRTSEMAQCIKILVARLNDTSPVPRTMRWKERADSHTLFSSEYHTIATM